MITIKFDDKYETTGTTIAASWDKTKPYLRILFGLSYDECLTGVELTEKGITARITKVTEAQAVSK